MRNKKFLLAALVIACVSAVTISTIVLGSGRNTKDSAGEGPLEENDGEVIATLPFFHRADENYTRGSLPLRGGIRTLERLGVRTLVDLRSIYDHTDEIQQAASAAHLEYVWLPMSVWNPPTDDEARKFVEVVTQKSNGPFFVFCADGVNRTGEMTAIYRIAESKWTPEKALDEADRLGFNPYYYTLRNYVWDYARKFNPSSLPPAARKMSPIEN